MIKRSLFLLIFIFAYSAVFPYKNIKVVLIANKENQKDSFGYNIVSSLAQWTYNKLKEGKIKMWATPYKTEVMDFNALQGMEISSKMNFIDCQNIFLYEMWSSDKSETSFTITGISFSSENQNAEMVSFGFIDFSEIEELLKNDLVPVDINGSYNTTFNQVFMNKSYDFEIVYFKDNPIQSQYSKSPEADFKNGVKIKTKAFNQTKLNRNYLPVKQAKMIEYSIRTTDYDLQSGNMISAIVSYFNNNKKDLYKYGGNEIYNYFSNTKLFLSECVISEIWTKEGGKLYYSIQQIVPVSVGIPFNPIPAADIERFNIIIDQQTLSSLLETKQFSYHLISINGTRIDETKEAQYLKALSEADWTKITTIGNQ